MSQYVITVILTNNGEVNCQATPGMTKTEVLGLLEMAKQLYVESWKFAEESRKAISMPGNGQTDRLFRG